MRVGHQDNSEILLHKNQINSWIAFILNKKNK